MFTKVFTKVLKFKQSDWMKKYIDEKKRQMLLIALNKKFLKLMIDSAYGKKVENV